MYYGKVILPNVVKKEEKMADIKFFGEVDLHKKTGKISSEYPAWYFDRPLDNLREEVEHMERALERGGVPADKQAENRVKLENTKARYENILQSIPKLSPQEKDRLAKARKTMGEEIRSGFFTRSQMDKGTADAFKEAERMMLPKIEVKPEFADLLHSCNVPVVDGRVTRDNLAKAWKILGKALNRNGGEEETNVETLRRD
jgi:hypothetical protein